jgi:hypothetical protein
MDIKPTAKLLASQFSPFQALLLRAGSVASLVCPSSPKATKPPGGPARAIILTSENPVYANFPEWVEGEVRAEDRAGNAGNRSDHGNRTGGYSSSPTNSSRGTPYAPASFVTVGM